MIPQNIKPALTFEQQLRHLIDDKKLTIKNEDNALTILKHENYYRLSGYMIDFLEHDDTFKKGVCFEDIYDVYKTDKEIRSTLFELINDIEVYLKTQIANYFSLEYGPLGYLNPDNFEYKAQKSYCDVLSLIRKCSEVNKNNSTNLIIKHHEDNYKGFVPIWALVELMSLGTISKFYSLLKTKDKKSICRTGFSDISYEKVESFYHSVSYLRNQCCHYQRFYRKNHPIKAKAYFSKTVKFNPYNTKTTYSLVVALLLLNPNKKLGERVISRLKDIEKHSSISLTKDYGFEQTWKKDLHTLNTHCINL